MQSQAYITPALGKAGTISRLNPVPQHLPFVAEGDGVVAGKFVFAGTNPETQVVGLGAADEVPAGLAIFEKYQPNLGENGLTINEGEQLAVLLRGCAYIIATAAATKGMKVGVTPTTGAIEIADTLSTGVVDTGWVVETGGASGAVIEIKNV